MSVEYQHGFFAALIVDFGNCSRYPDAREGVRYVIHPLAMFTAQPHRAAAVDSGDDAGTAPETNATVMRVVKNASALHTTDRVSPVVR